MAEGTVKEIRAWLAMRPEGELRDLYLAFGGATMRAALKSLDKLEKNGEITISAAVYKYGRKHGNEGREEKQTAIYNALRAWGKVSRVVPLGKILESSRATAGYALRYLNFLQRLGYVDKRGAAWLVLMKAVNQPKVPHFNQRKEARHESESAHESA